MEGAGVRLPFETWEEVISAGEKVSNAERKMFALVKALTAGAVKG